jgi:hypothetical protein
MRLMFGWAFWGDGLVFSAPMRKAVRVFENNPTLATMRPSRTWGTRFRLLLLCIGDARDGAGYGFDAVGALEGEHPAGVFGWEGADFVELLEFVGRELEVDGGDVVFELVETFGSDDDGGDEGLCEDIGEGNARGAAVVGFGDGGHDVEDAPGALLVDDGEVELGAAGVDRLLVFAGELAGEETTGERAPDEEAGFFRFEERDDVALEIAAGDGVVGLEGVEAGEVFKLGDAEGLGDLPCLPVGAADVADFALLDEGVESAESLFDGVTASLPWIW